MDVEFDFSDRVALVTGVTGFLGSAVAAAALDANATVVGTSREAPDGGARDGVDFHAADLTVEEDVRELFEAVIDTHGRLDMVYAVAGTYAGGTPIEETDRSTYETVLSVNLTTAFLTAKYALPHLQESEGSIVTVSARASLSGGQGDGPYRVSKAGVRLLTETIAEENRGTVRANAVMPSVIDTPANREMIPDPDVDAWPDPAEIAHTMLALTSDATTVTSGAAVPVYGEA